MGGDVVASAFCSRTNQTTSHATTKLAAAAKKKINDRFIKSLLLPGDIGGHRGVASPQKSDKLWYFANNADSCKRVLRPNLRAVAHQGCRTRGCATNGSCKEEAGGHW